LRNNNGWTVLHLAIWYGDVATLEILTSFNLNKLDPEATIEDRDTAADLLVSRKDPLPDGFAEAFQRLLNKLRCGNEESLVTTDEEDEQDEEDEDDGEAEFAHALEEQ
jgi:ankyrin repeat protein